MNNEYLGKISSVKEFNKLQKPNEKNMIKKLKEEVKKYSSEDFEFISSKEEKGFSFDASVVPFGILDKNVKPIYIDVEGSPISPINKYWKNSLYDMKEAEIWKTIRLPLRKIDKDKYYEISKIPNYKNKQHANIIIKFSPNLESFFAITDIEYFRNNCKIIYDYCKNFKITKKTNFSIYRYIYLEKINLLK